MTTCTPGPNAAQPLYIARSSDGSCVDVGNSLVSFLEELRSRWSRKDGDVAVWLLEAGSAARIVAVVCAGPKGEGVVMWP
jgi:hypothetical protein